MPSRDGTGQLFPEEAIPERDLAYIAGLFDGEGCVVIARLRSKGLPRYELTVRIAMTHLAGMQFCARVFGGKVPPLRKRTDNSSWSPKAAWALNGPKALRFLKTIRPFLLVKAQDADVGIQFMEEYQLPWKAKGRGSILSPKRVAAGEKYKTQLAALHGMRGTLPGPRGKHPPSLEPTLL